MSAEAIIRKFNLMPHPEGGYFTETYRASEEIAASAVPERFDGNRSHSTAILFLLQAGDISQLHRIKSDEVWHFYAGDPLHLFEVTPDGTVLETILGTDYAQGHVPQYVVKAGHYFGGFSSGTYSFVGCTVSPGFDFADFEFADHEALLASFPAARSVIKRLSPVLNSD
ncbi:MAG: cupin domain-containing protein [Pseudomonadota bacterium]